MVDFGTDQEEAMVEILEEDLEEDIAAEVEVLEEDLAADIAAAEVIQENGN